MPERVPGAGSAAVAALLTLGLGIFLLLRRPEVDLVLHLYAVGMAIALAAALLARGFARVEEEPGRLHLGARWAAWRRPPPGAPVRALEEVERALEFSRSSAFDVHYRLRPHLERAAAHLLRARHGLSLESPAARGRLGEEAWELVRPGRPAPVDRHGRGLDPAALRRVLAALEAL